MLYATDSLSNLKYRVRFSIVQHFDADEEDPKQFWSVEKWCLLVASFRHGVYTLSTSTVSCFTFRK